MIKIPYSDSNPSDAKKFKTNVLFERIAEIDPRNITEDDAKWFSTHFTNNCDVIDGRKINKKRFTLSQRSKLMMCYLAFDIDCYIGKPIDEYTPREISYNAHIMNRQKMVEFLEGIGAAFIWYTGINDGKEVKGFVKESTHFIVFFDAPISYNDWSDYSGQSQVMKYLVGNRVGCDFGPLCVNQHLKPGHGGFGFKNGKLFPVSTFFKREIQKKTSITYKKELTEEQKNFHESVVKVDKEHLIAVVSDACHNIASVQDTGIVTDYFEWSYLLAGGIKSLLGDDGEEYFIKASSTYMDGKDDADRCVAVYNHVPPLSIFAFMTVYDILMGRTKLPENRVKSTTLKNTFIKLSGLGRFDVYDIIQDSYKMKSKMSRIIYTESNGKMNVKEIVEKISQHYKVPYEVMRSYYRFKIFDKKTELVDEGAIREQIVSLVITKIMESKFGYMKSTEIKTIIKFVCGSYKSRTLTLKSIKKDILTLVDEYRSRGEMKMRIKASTSLEITQSTPTLIKEPIEPPMPSNALKNDIYMADEITGVVADEDGVIIVIDQEPVSVDYDRLVIKKDYWGTEISRYTVPDQKIVGYQNVGHIFTRKFDDFDKMITYQAKLKAVLELYGLDSNGRPLVDRNIKPEYEITDLSELESCWAVDERTNRVEMYA